MQKVASALTDGKIRFSDTIQPKFCFRYYYITAPSICHQNIARRKFCVGFTNACECAIIQAYKAKTQYAPMAQLDSASDSDSDGWRFESVWVRHSKSLVIKGFFHKAPKRILYPLLTRLAQCATIAITLTSLATNPPGCTTQKPQFLLRFYRILQADLVPIADAIGATRNNRYYVHFVHYESVWVRHQGTRKRSV